MPEKIHIFKSLQQEIQEATASVEQELNIEDEGWTLLGQASRDVVTGTERIANVNASRLYYTKDPLAKQAIRLWTDYTFGSGMTLDAEEDSTQKVLDSFWDAPYNRPVLSSRGQRKSSDKHLVDGEIFNVLFLGSGGIATIRWIDPLEIVEIITDVDDIENVMHYKRQWTDIQGSSHINIYRSATNLKDEASVDSLRQPITSNDDGVVFHLPCNTIGQRGNPLLLPALDWIKQYRRFLASRVAIMLALTRFAWKMKVLGGQTSVDTAKGKLEVDDDPPQAGAVAAMNAGVDLNPIKTDSGASNAYQDGRMLKLQVSAATGIPEQYFGDISIGNLATAKTVELPMMKMFQSSQAVWEDYYRGILELVFEHNGIKPDKWYVDINWPLIAPRDIEGASNAIGKMVATFPTFSDSDAIKQAALTILGIDDVAEALKQIDKAIEGNPDAKFARSLRELKTILKGNNVSVERV